MAYYPYSYTLFDFNSIIQQWTSIGVFNVILPMVLIFTVVYAILQRTKILGGKTGIDAIVGLVIGFFAVSNQHITDFFRYLFPNFAIGIVLLIVCALLVGLLAPGIPRWWNTAMAIGGVLIFFWVVWRAADSFGGYVIFSSQWWSANAIWVVPLILFGILIAVVMASGQPRQTPAEKAWEAFLGKKTEI